MHLWSGATGALLMQLKQRCLPSDFLGKHALGVDEHLDFLVDALRPVHVSQAERTVSAPPRERDHDVITPEAS